MQYMKFLPVKTRKLYPPKDDFFKALNANLPKLKDGDVLLIASKVLAIHQGRCEKNQEPRTKSQKNILIKKEADYSLPSHMVNSSDIILTIKDYTLIPSAGIDESNGNGYFILWPRDVNRLLKKLVMSLKKKHRLKNLAAIAVDSHTTPLRWGTQGISIGFYGLKPVYDYRGKKDIFNRKLKYTQRNLVDTLADLGALMMGEGNEQTPAVILRGAKFVKFTNQDTYKQLVIPPKKDLYYPLLKPFLKRR
jgi:dihydrofolate synthase / folylpolyglutamate synthase